MIFIIFLLCIVTSDLVTEDLLKDYQYGFQNSLSQVSILNCVDTETFMTFSGENITLSKLYEINFPHYIVGITFSLLKPQNGVEFWFFLDDQIYSIIDNSDGSYLMCNEDQTLIKSKQQFFKSHVGQTLAVTISIHNSNVNSIWGISSIQIEATPCPKNCLACQGTYFGNDCDKWIIFEESFMSTHIGQFGMDGWVSSNLGSTNCVNMPIVGGYGMYGSKSTLQKIIKLKPHHLLRIIVMWVKIDSWDTEKGLIQIDGLIVWSKDFNNHVDHGGNICGNKNTTYSTQFVSIDVTAQHTGNLAEIKFTSTLDQTPTDESFGIRGLQIFYAPCAENCDVCTSDSKFDCLKCSHGYYLQGECIENDIFQLFYQEFNDQKFTSANNWQFNGVYNKQKTISLIQGQSIIGGVGIFGQGTNVEKQFYLPFHQRIRIQMLFYRIDSWDNEEFQIIVDDIIVWSQKFDYSNGSNMVGDFWVDKKIYIDFIFEHQQQELILKFCTTLDEDSKNESWGFRDFKLYFDESSIDNSIQNSISLNILLSCLPVIFIFLNF